MLSHVIYKVPNGKMIRLEMDYDKERIDDIVISGDFFMHPEDAIDLIEQALIGVDIKESKITETIKQVVEQENIEFFGVDIPSLTRAIMICAGKIKQ
jgi:hypothetical protein